MNVTAPSSLPSASTADQGSSSVQNSPAQTGGSPASAQDVSAWQQNVVDVTQNGLAVKKGTADIAGNLRQLDGAQPQNLGQYQAKQSAEALGGDFVALENGGASSKTAGTLARDFGSIVKAPDNASQLQALQRTATDLNNISPPASNLAATGALSQAKSDLGYLQQAVQTPDSSPAPAASSGSSQVTRLIQQVNNTQAGGNNSAGAQNELVQLGNVKSIVANDGGGDQPQAVQGAVQDLVNSASTQVKDRSGAVGNEAANVDSANTAVTQLVNTLTSNDGGLNGSQGSLESLVSAQSDQTAAGAAKTAPSAE